MQIFINNQMYQIPGPEAIDKVLKSLNLYAGKGIAVAVNSQVIPRGEWPSVVVKENDKLTIIRASQGG